MNEDRITVASVTEEKAEELRNTLMPNGMYYNPILINNNVWIVSMLEAQYIPSEQLTLVDYIKEEEEEEI